MILRFQVIVSLLTLALVLGMTPAFAIDYAVTSSTDSIYLVKYDGATVSSSLISEISGASFSGIATQGSYVFVADNSSSTAPTLRVGQIRNPLAPTISWIGAPIDLTSGRDRIGPTRTVVADSTGVYVLGDLWTDNAGYAHSSYAYVTGSSGWTTASVNLVNVQPPLHTTNSLTDIAINPSGGAVIAYTDPGGLGSDQSCIRTVNGAIIGTSLTPEGDNGYAPTGITVGKGFTYMVNLLTRIDNFNRQIGSISISNTNPLSPAISEVLQLGNISPTDVAFFTNGSSDYLGIVGRTDTGISQAWRVKLGLDGISIAGTIDKVDLGFSGENYCSVNASDTLFWVTNPKTQKVIALDTSTWTASTSSALDSPAKYIAWASAPVPEPSSLLTLLVGGIGLLKFRRRQKQA